MLVLVRLLTKVVTKFVTHMTASKALHAHLSGSAVEIKQKGDKDMKKIKVYGKALWSIAEKSLMTLMGIGLVVIAQLKFSSYELQVVVQIVGILSFLAGTIPMFWAFAKANWPKK